MPQVIIRRSFTPCIFAEAGTSLLKCEDGSSNIPLAGRSGTRLLGCFPCATAENMMKNAQRDLYETCDWKWYISTPYVGCELHIDRVRCIINTQVTGVRN